MAQINASVGSVNSSIVSNRPKFSQLWNAYPVGLDADGVYKLVGGNVYEHYVEDPINYANACAIRLSRAFNYGGLLIKKGPGAYKLKGGDGKAYIIRVSDMIKYVRSQFGSPDIVVKGNNASSQFMSKKGVIIFTVSGWSDATGHVTLWNGADCGDHCYFTHPQPGVKTEEVQFWELK